MAARISEKNIIIFFVQVTKTKRVKELIKEDLTSEVIKVLVIVYNYANIYCLHGSQYAGLSHGSQ